MSENKIETAILDWLYEHENFGQRIERAPKEIIPWAFEAARIGKNVADKDRAEFLRILDGNLEDIQSICSNPTYNHLEVGFRHQPLTIKESNERLLEAFEEVNQIVTAMRNAIKDE